MHWAQHRINMINSASIPEPTSLVSAIEDWYDSLPHVLPQDEPEAHGDVEHGTTIQRCRKLYQHELTYDDVEFMQDVGYSLEEYIEYLRSVGGLDTNLTLYTDADLDLEDPEGKTEEPQQFVSQDYEHSVADGPDSQDTDAVSAISFAYGEVEELPMPPLSAAYWKKEAVFVCRALVKKIDRKIEYLVAKFTKGAAKAERSKQTPSEKVADEQGDCS